MGAYCMSRGPSSCCMMSKNAMPRWASGCHAPGTVNQSPACQVTLIMSPAYRMKSGAWPPIWRTVWSQGLNSCRSLIRAKEKG